jgi:hypothetical protein
MLTCIGQELFLTEFLRKLYPQKASWNMAMVKAVLKDK